MSLSKFKCWIHIDIHSIICIFQTNENYLKVWRNDDGHQEGHHGQLIFMSRPSYGVWFSDCSGCETTNKKTVFVYFLRLDIVPAMRHFHCHGCVGHREYRKWAPRVQNETLVFYRVLICRRLLNSSAAVICQWNLIFKIQIYNDTRLIKLIYFNPKTWC